MAIAFSTSMCELWFTGRWLYCFLPLAVATRGHVRSFEKTRVKSLGSSSLATTLAFRSLELNSIITACICESSVSFQRDWNAGERSICFTLRRLGLVGAVT